MLMKNYSSSENNIITKKVDDVLNKKVDKLLCSIGNTTLKKLDYSQCNLYVKMESENQFSKSAKDRSALFSIKDSLDQGILTTDSILVESSSGNFGLALAMISHTLGIGFEAIIDENITLQKKQLIEFFAAKVTMIEKADYSGGYLLSRLEMVENRLATNNNYVNLNQYKNKSCIRAFAQMAEEIETQLPNIDYIFVSVSTGATMTGILSVFTTKKVKVVGVDVEGSIFFEDKPKKRNFSGLGTSQKSFFIDQKNYDYEYVIVPEEGIIDGCKSFFNQHSILSGASTGAIFYAIENYKFPPNTNVVMINHDDGYSYFDSVYIKQNF